MKGPVLLLQVGAGVQVGGMQSGRGTRDASLN